MGITMTSKFRFFLILALLISLFLEITLFNYTHYATLFTSKHFSVMHNEQGVLLPDSLSEFNMKDLNTDIASIYIEPIFLHRNIQHIKVTWADEESSQRSIQVSIIKGLDFSNYININPHGKVSNLSIAFFENNIAIKSIEINKEIPMAIMPIRLVIVFAISLLLICLLNAEIRKKISWFCFDYLYDNVNFRQRIGFAMLICSMLAFNFFAAYSTLRFRDNELALEWFKMYSHHMTDALLKKQLHLDIEVPQALLEAERPYDDEYRKQHGMFTIQIKEPSETLLLHDHVYYKGKYYSYFGLVPVIILFAPYKLITGNYLPTSMGIFLFASIATVLLMLLWKQIAQNYLKRFSYFFFLMSAAALYASSLIPIHICMLYGFHPISQYSALAFVIFGVIMLLQAREKLSIWLLVAFSFSFALAVACRPTALFWSILIPVTLWDKRKELMNNASNIFAIAIPFIIVGSILAWYNYVRFGSPFEFGEIYMLGDMNTGMVNKIGIIGKIHFLVKAFLFYLFNPPNLDLTFPFVSQKESNIPLATIGRFATYQSIVGIFCFPVMWFLFYIRKVNILRNFIFAGIFISSLNIVSLILIICYQCWRYVIDFSWFMAIGALICAFQLQEKETAMRKIILKAFYSCSGITLLLIFFLTIHSSTNIIRPLDSKIYYYLARTFGVICNVP